MKEAASRKVWKKRNPAVQNQTKPLGRREYIFWLCFWTQSQNQKIFHEKGFQEDSCLRAVTQVAIVVISQPLHHMPGVFLLVLLFLFQQKSEINVFLRRRSRAGHFWFSWWRIKRFWGNKKFPCVNSGFCEKDIFCRNYFPRKILTISNC